MFHEPLSLFLAQIITIVAVSRLFGVLARRIGQPAVIGEMFAGIVLGPSILGAVFPEVSAVLFPRASLSSLQMLSQVGVLLFLFIVGMELDTKLLRNNARTALIVSPVSIVVPFGLGVGLSVYLYSGYHGSHGNYTSFALFMGIAMSITAFPVLVRILDERGMTQTSLGVLAIACAAIDDATAWCLLAFIVALAKSTSAMSAAWSVAAVLIFTATMFFVLRPILKKIYQRFAGDAAAEPSREMVALMLILLFSAALLTEFLGIHALFGAFIAGVIVPKNHSLQKHMRERLEYFSTLFLLPIFFAFTGLRTELKLLGDGGSWLMALVITTTAVAGKFGGSALAARFTGMPWRDAASLGVLMNTRGLMELIVLNVGYDLGILSPTVFAMMVIMALTTTFMTSPALTFFVKK